MTDSFDEFARRELPGLLRLAGVLAGDRGIAEDVVQEVLLRTSRRWEAIGASTVPAAYVRRMVVNEYISWRRKWARIVPHAEVADERHEPDHAERHVERDALNRRLDRLPPKQRAVLVLRYYEGLSDEAVAELLDCSTGTVRSHASRALATLRIDLDPAGDEPVRALVPRRPEGPLMPTLDDLHAVLADRERHAGDADTVLAAVTNPPRRGHLARPLLAAAAVVALAAGAIALAGSDDHPSAPAANGDGAPPPLPQWTMTTSDLDGFDVARLAVDPTQQVDIVHASTGARGFVTVYATGVPPKEIVPGRAVRVGDADGFFVAGTPPRTVDSTMAAAFDDPDAFAKLRWEYAPGAWVEIMGTFGYQPDSRSYDNERALAVEQRIAAAVRVGDPQPVEMPFALRDLPAGLVPESATPGSAPTCIGYDDNSDDPYTSALTVCRTTDPSPEHVTREDADRVVVHAVGDGTTLTLVLSADRLDLLTTEQLQRLADTADTSPVLSDPSTWLPVR